MTDAVLNIIASSFPLREIDTGEFHSFKASGMKFTLSSYSAEGLGWVSVMKAKGFFGLMKMDTLIVTPFSKDMPLLSYDRIVAMGNDTLIIEAYDTTLNKSDLSSLEKINASFSSLPERDPGSHWYDSIKLSVSVSKKGKAKTEGKSLDEYTKEYIKGYIRLSSTSISVDPKLKKEKNALYSEGLLENGGPATDVFIKTMGKEKTAEVFRSFLFGTDRF